MYMGDKAHGINIDPSLPYNLQTALKFYQNNSVSRLHLVASHLQLLSIWNNSSGFPFVTLLLLKIVIVIQLLRCAQLFEIPWTTACQCPLSFTISWSLLSFISVELVMLSNHLTLCLPLLLLPLVFASIRVFSNESALHIPKLLALELQLQHQSFQ